MCHILHDDKRQRKKGYLTKPPKTNPKPNLPFLSYFLSWGVLSEKRWSHNTENIKSNNSLPIHQSDIEVYHYEIETWALISLVRKIELPMFTHSKATVFILITSQLVHTPVQNCTCWNYGWIELCSDRLF